MERDRLLTLVIVKLDTLIHRQLNLVLHHPQFQQLEASWRGVALLVQSKEHSKRIIIRLLSVTLKEIARDLSHAIEFDQSHLFQKLYCAEYDTPGGEPYSLLLADYYFYDVMMSHNKTNYSKATHSQINHSQTNHSQTNHSQTNHSQTNHSKTNHSQTNHGQTTHSKATHSPTNHSQTNHSEVKTVMTTSPPQEDVMTHYSVSDEQWLLETACHMSTDTLLALSQIAAAAFAPLITSVDAKLFGLDSFRDIKPTFRFEQILRQYPKWQQLRLQQDSRFLGLTVSRVLLRQAHGTYEKRHKEADYLWGNPIYAYGTIAIQSFQQTGWFDGMRGIAKRPYDFGAIYQTPVRQKILGHYDECWQRLVFESYFTDSMEKQLSDLGFIVFKDQPQMNRAILFHNQSYYLSQPQNSREDHRIDNMLHYLFCVCRFAHYVKIMMRNKIGSFLTADACERFLQRWLLNYTVDHKDGASLEKIVRPLRSARVKLSEKFGVSGHYHCLMYLQPHYQLEGFHAELCLETHIDY